MGSQPAQVGKKLRAPKKTHDVPMQLPELPCGNLSPRSLRRQQFRCA